MPPEVLQRQQQQAIESTSISKVAKANATPSLTRLSIDQLIDAKNLAQGVDENTEDLLDLTATESAGFERYYAEEFANSKPARASGTQRSLAAGNTQTVAPVTKPIKRPATAPMIVAINTPNALNSTLIPLISATHSTGSIAVMIK